MATAQKLLKRWHVCGVTCHKGGKNCNGYCTNQAINAPATYEVGLHTFSMALIELVDGKRIARQGWNGKGMWITLVKNGHYDVGVNTVGGATELLPWIGMKTADNKFVPWLASQTDILAEDWVIVE